MLIPRRQLILFAGAAIGAAAVPRSTWSQPSFPIRPVRVVVPYPAGGTTDVITRAVSHALSGMWGQQVIVENKGGAGTQIGAELVAKSAADGYTLLATAEATFVVNPYLYSKLSYDPNDFMPVSGLGVSRHVLVAHPSVPIRDVSELIALAKARPGDLNYGTFGAGSSSHLNMAMFESMAGVKLTPVHYRGAAPMLNDLIGGHIPMAFIGATLAAQPIKAGQIRALGIGSSKRLAELPDVPTIAEGGLPGFQAVSWFGVFAPSGTPLDLVTRINADIQKVLISPEFREKSLDPIYLERIGGSPEQFADYIKADAARWSKVIKEAKLSAD